MKRVFFAMIDFYQQAVSPYLPRTCRFAPSCSEYMKEAVGQLGFVHGLTKGVWRILRCQPFSRGGWEPPVKLEGSQQ